MRLRILREGSNFYAQVKLGYFRWCYISCSGDFVSTYKLSGDSSESKARERIDRYREYAKPLEIDKEVVAEWSE